MIFGQKVAPCNRPVATGFVWIFVTVYHRDLVLRLHAGVVVYEGLSYCLLYITAWCLTLFLSQHG